MKCQVCGNSNPNDSQFCNKCGAKLGLFCPKCGSEVEKDDLFCKKCGNPLEKAAKKTSKSPAAGLTETPTVGQPGQSENSYPQKKKVPIWILIVAGVIIVLCAVVAITGGFSFNIGNSPKKAVISNTTASIATITPIIVPSATPQATPTLAPTPTPAYAMGKFDPFCEAEQVQFLFEHQHISVGGFILASEEDKDQYFQDFIDSAVFSSVFDGEQIAPLMKFYQPAFDEESGFYKLSWGFDADPLPVGAHFAESTLTFSKPFTIPQSQGGYNVGPGTELESIPFQCPLIVGAPDASWNVIAETDFSIDKDIFLSKEIQNENVKQSSIEGENGVFRVSIQNLNADAESLMSSFYKILNQSPKNDIIISFDAKVTENAENASYGVSLRQTYGSSSGHYGLNVNPKSQQVTFYVVPIGSIESTNLFDAQVPTVLQEGNNRITLLANGPNFWLLINDKQVFFLEDSTILTAGDAGISILTKGSDQSVYEFDNFVARSPNH